MLLTIDLGNTNITLGLYQGDQLGPRWRLATVHERMPDEYGLQFLHLLAHAGFSPADITGICLASVVPPLTGKTVQACVQYLGPQPLVVDAGVKTGVRVRYEDPRAVGADRKDLANKAAAETDPKKRIPMYHELLKLLVDEGPYAMLVQGKVQVVTRPNIRGYQYFPLGYAYLQPVSKD